MRESFSDNFNLFQIFYFFSYIEKCLNYPFRRFVGTSQPTLNQIYKKKEFSFEIEIKTLK